MKISVALVGIVIGMIIFTIGYFARDPTVGLSMLLAYLVGILVGLSDWLIEEQSYE